MGEGPMHFMEGDSLPSFEGAPIHHMGEGPMHLIGGDSTLLLEREKILEMREGGMPGMERGGMPEMEGGMPGMPGMEGEMTGMMNLPEIEISPLWIPCTITYDGKEWNQVGLRFKGNSSLQHTYMDGNSKLSMKLNFDKYEDDYPELKNQRFYGFKQLNLNNNYNDGSLMREKVASDMFREFGVVSAQTAYYEIYVDYGEGAKYYGVYTIIEEIDDSAIKSNFSDDSGNLYKPEDMAATFAEGTFDKEGFNLKSKDDKSYNDVLSLYEALHSSQRTSNSKRWKKELESVFDVDNFLRWLAANGVMQNWDTYGNMSHNYFLYGDPQSGVLTWIPWDNNECFKSEMIRWDVDKIREINSSWPLISYILAEDEYFEIYKSYLREFVEEVYTPENMNAICSGYYSIIKDSVYAEREGCSFIRSNQEFDNAVATLKAHAASRATFINNFLK